MSQRNVELLIGRLLTDEEMRRRFMRKPGGALEDFCRQGWELSQGEIEALGGDGCHDVVGARLAHPFEAAALQPQDPLTGESSYFSLDTPRLTRVGSARHRSAPAETF